MKIQDIQSLYAHLPQVSALAKLVGDKSVKTISLDGLLASSAPLAFSALALKSSARMLFILQDAEEAGYFYHDLCQVMGDKQVLFFPSSYKRAIKYGSAPSNTARKTPPAKSFAPRFSPLLAQTSNLKPQISNLKHQTSISSLIPKLWPRW